MSNELYHYGVPGMKWGRRKIQRYSQKENLSRESAKEWREMAKYRSDRLRARGHENRANKIQAKYNKRATQDYKDANKYANRTYESVIAGGGSKGGARAVTLVASVLGPTGHLLASRKYTKMAGQGRTPKRF